MMPGRASATIAATYCRPLGAVNQRRVVRDRNRPTGPEKSFLLPRASRRHRIAASRACRSGVENEGTRMRRPLGSAVAAVGGLVALLLLAVALTLTSCSPTFESARATPPNAPV